MKNLISLEGYRAMQEEYERLLNKERPELTRVIAWAAGNGDRSENADYQYGKKRLREIDRRLRYLGSRLKTLRSVDLASLTHRHIQFGATVWLEDEHGQSKRVTIVGDDEVDPKRGLISLASPLGHALNMCEEGEIIEFKAPKGEMVYTIVKIAYLSLSQLGEIA